MRSSGRSILFSMLFALPLLAPSAVDAQKDTGKESCRWRIHESTISICVQLADRFGDETEQHHRAVVADLMLRIDDLKKLALISDDLRWLGSESHNANNAAEQERRLQIIGKTSWNLCRNRNARSACRAAFRLDKESSLNHLGADEVLRTMQADVSFCIGVLKDSGVADVRYPERLQNIAAGAVRLSALFKPM